MIYDQNSKSYIEPISTDPVIKYINHEFIQIKTKHLKDYLAARKMLLVRFHEHCRYTDRPIMEIIGKDYDSFDVKNDSQLYTIQVFDEEGNTCAKLRGKDIIVPYDEPLHYDYHLLSGKSQKYENFICELDIHGNTIEYSCTPKQASNEFLRPVYFKKDVLQKYWSNPRIYRVVDGHLSYLDIWDISYGQNKCDLIIVWLGDLGKLPYEEQQHWKQHNTHPEGVLEKYFTIAN